MKRALLLNADWVPLQFVPDIEAFIMVYKGNAEIIEYDGKHSIWENEAFTSPGRTWEVPATIRLLERINKRWKAPRFRKKVLFNRDNWMCQYCRLPLNWETVTIDHVVPRSQRGDTSWKNCVASCKPCNRRKANRTPSEANMQLLKVPTEPSSFHFWDTMKTTCWHEHWNDFLPNR